MISYLSEVGILLLSSSRQILSSASGKKDDLLDVDEDENELHLRTIEVSVNLKVA